MNQYLSFFMLLLTLFSFHTGSRAENTSPARKPSIILIPAAFSKASVYDLVKAQLSTAGYETIAIDLPSVGKRAAHVDRTPDIKVVQAALAERLLMGKNVILVGNSYGATVICDAVKNFEDNSSLRRHGLHGKILGLIFVSPNAPQVHATFLSSRPCHMCTIFPRNRTAIDYGIVLRLHTHDLRTQKHPARHPRHLPLLVPLRRHIPRLLGCRHGCFPTLTHPLQPAFSRRRARRS
jgi:pimeloyl-ACP methyl ester carboxylesterase